MRSFKSPAWAKDAVIYQVFPDRFRNGSQGNDPRTGDIRYDDPVQALAWGTQPEGYCRGYVGRPPPTAHGASASLPRPPATWSCRAGATTRAGT